MENFILLLPFKIIKSYYNETNHNYFKYRKFKRKCRLWNVKKSIKKTSYIYSL